MYREVLCAKYHAPIPNDDNERYALKVGRTTVANVATLERVLDLSRPLVVLWQNNSKLPHVKIVDNLTGEVTTLIN